ncbi:coiled-coil domain-containing protein 137 isoform X1 [Tachypleus tridentatus]|uniref:coiled-coil domain-containing protein 137 isoform X1 n=1 Tax=Tachypleus tridentatus TaxID=6853 RepID=UPI003FD38F31
MCCNIISVVTDIASKNKPISLLSNRTNIKMGRRIQKSKRHKKIKSVDPFQKGKEFRHQNQHTNHEPSDEDIQEVPRRLQELIKMKTLAKENKLRNKKKKFKKHDRITVTSDVVVGDVQGMKRPLKEVPYKIQQEEYESEFQFIQRLHHATERAIAEVRMEEKYGINKEEQDLAIVNSQTKENGESSKRKRNFHEKKRLKKKMKREEKIDDFGYLKDDVSFGETASHPPSLKIRPKMGRTNDKKAGERQLFLKNCISKDVATELVSSNKKKKLDLTVKRQELSFSDHRRLEAERKKAIELYRLMKTHKCLKT